MAKKVIVGRQSNEAISNYLKKFGGDGHAIIIPEALVKMGFDVKFVAPYIFVEKSGKHPKEQLFDNEGNAVKELEGVYSLSFAYGIAANIGADTTKAYEKMGRGFQAQELYVAIDNVINPKEVNEVKDPA